MKRREFIAAIGGAAAVWPFAVRAQQSAMPVIGYLGIGSPDTEVSLAAFRQGLSEAGYAEGQSVTIHYRWAEGDPERFPALAAELVMLKVHVILTAGGTLAAIAAKRATAAIPIVFTAVGDPVEEGLVANLARPGGNVTGLSVTLPDLIGKWLELLKEAVPGASRVALLLKPDAMPDRVREVRLKEADVSARALGVELQVFEARGREDFDGVFSDMSKARAGALVVWPTPVFQLERRRLADLAAEHRLPAVFPSRSHVEAGGLMSYGPNLPDLNRRAAIYVGKILKGTKPSDLPVEQPTKYELVINLKTAKALGLTVPPSLLARADEVIE
jgi:putative tryptophan/tyrosine transport system substrate-binding protein